MNDDLNYREPYWQISRWSENYYAAQKSPIKVEAVTVPFSEEQLSKVVEKIGDLRAQIICGAGISQQINLLSDIESMLVGLK